MISDGNNFGVEIQEFAVKTLAEKKKATKDLFDGLNAYSTARGDLWGKVSSLLTVPPHPHSSLCVRHDRLSSLL